MMTFVATWMNRDYHTECSKSYKERQISYDINYMWNLKDDTNELIYKAEIEAKTQKTKLWLPKQGVNQEFGIKIKNYIQNT